LIAILVLILSVSGLVGVHVVTDREETIRDATTDAVNLRESLIEHTRQTFATIDLALLSIIGQVTPSQLGREDGYHALLVRQSVIGPTFALFILDAGGRLAASSRTPDPEPVDFSTEAVFTAHRDDPSLGLFIEPPRRGRVGYAKDKWIVTVSRRINHVDGSFAGAIAAALSIEYLTTFYDALRRGQEGVVGLMTAGGAVIARSPFNQDYIGRVLSDSRLFREMLPSAGSGVYRARYVTDNVDRITAYGRVPKYPLVVYVGISATERLALWREHAAITGVSGLLTLLMLIGLAVLIARIVGERRREQQARVGQLTKLTEISESLVECSDVESAMRLVVDKARELVPCHQAVVSLTEHPSMAQVIHSVSLSDKYAAWKDYDEKPDGSGIYQNVCRTSRPIRLTQAELEAHADWRGFGAARERHPPMRGWLAVPLTADDGTNLGLIQLSDRTSGDFTAEDQALLVELAHVTGGSIQRLRMADDLRSAAATAERLRIDAEAARRSEAVLRR